MSGGRFEDVHPDGGLRGLEPEFLDVDGTETRYYDVGEGEPLVTIQRCGVSTDRHPQIRRRGTVHERRSRYRESRSQTGTAVLWWWIPK